MQIKTNYQKSDWKKMSIFLLVFIPLMVVPVLGFANYIFLPGMDMWFFTNTFLEKAISSDLLSFLESNTGLTENSTDAEKDEHLSFILGFAIMLLLAAYGPIIILALIFGTVIKYCYYLSQWICTKLKIKPAMNLVVIKNNKIWFTLKP